MHRSLFVAFAASALACAACTEFKIAAQGGFTKVAITGDIALATTSGGSTASIQQDIESALGLGDEQGSPYARLQLDFGVPVLSVSAFRFDEQGQGRLNQQFGNIAAGTNVDSDLTFTNLKVAYAFQFQIGPVAVGPGIAVDVFDLQMQVKDTAGSATEDVDIVAPVPMAFARADVDLGIVAAVGELGYLKVPKIQDVEGTFWDAEAMVELRLAPLVLFAGYREMSLDVSGITSDQQFAGDLQVAGWLIGGGIRF